MTQLLGRDEFRAELENAIKGREAKNASFSKAWAEGKLEKHHFARWAENHYHYVGPFADYLANIYSNTPDAVHQRQRISRCRTCTRRNSPTSGTPTC